MSATHPPERISQRGPQRYRPQRGWRCRSGSHPGRYSDDLYAEHLSTGYPSTCWGSTPIVIACCWVIKLLNSLDKLSRGRTVYRILAPVSVEKTPVCRENKIPAELEHVLPGLPATRAPAREDEAQIACEHAPAQKHQPASALQAEISVSRQLGIANRGQRERNRRYRRWPRLRDDKHIRSCCVDLIHVF